MPKELDILLKKAHLVDPVNQVDGIKDIAIQGGKIVEVCDAIAPGAARDVHNLEGLVAIPGIIDSHVHASSLTGGRYAHRMLAAAGVTTALEMAGPVESVWEIMKSHGAGLNIACLQAVAPGLTVDKPNPTQKRLRTLFNGFVQKGALGFKILGGHFPLTPAASANCIKIAQEMKGYCAFHAGTTKSASDIGGFLEAIELAAGNHVHLAHVNSYCRGKNDSPLQEAVEALQALETNPNIFSESYLSPLNGTSGKIVENEPASKATSMWLKKFGFTPDRDGMRNAISSGAARVAAAEGGKMVLVEGQRAVRIWSDRNTDVLISFDINPADSRFILAAGRRRDGRFCVDCISTDGGGFPRNVIVELGLALVDFHAFSLGDFVRKTSTFPAGMLGLENKGHLGPGADADITVVDKARNKAFMGIAGGRIIMYAGHVSGTTGTALIRDEGKEHLRKTGLDYRILDPAKFYGRPM